MSRYKLGPVKPWVRAAAEEIGARYGISTIHGYGQRSNATDHDDGLALDFMTRRGGSIADLARAQARSLGVTYVIWNQRIWSAARNAEGWRPMPDRGSDTANHKDHVHVSFTASPPPGFIRGGAGGVPGATKPQGVGKGSATNAGFPGEDTAADLVGAAQRVAMFTGAIALGALLVAVGAAGAAAPALKRETEKTIRKGIGA